MVKRYFAKALIQFGELQRSKKLLEEAMEKFQELNLAVDLDETKQLLEDLEKDSSGPKE